MPQKTEWKRSQQLLSADRSILTIVDMQERLLPAIPNRELLLQNTQFLLQSAALLHIPTVFTEQYPKGLGHTAPELRSKTADCLTLEKSRFSAAQVLHGCEAFEASDNRSSKQTILVGIEAHICVLQTAMDLISLGYSVFVPGDAVASRHAMERDTALERMKSAGVVVTTSEAIVFEWCESADSPVFKAISRLVKERDRT